MIANEKGGTRRSDDDAMMLLYILPIELAFAYECSLNDGDMDDPSLK